MSRRLESYQVLLQQPLSIPARVLLIVGVLAIPLVFHLPLWTMAFESNQYPDPLRLAIHVDHLEGQKTAQRDDLREINSLNHYIGMRPLLESDFSEFLWMPFAMGFFALFCLRAVVLGNIRDATDLAVIYLYFGGFSAWNFYHRLYQYGHNLSPDAAIEVEPFTPPLYGRVRVANFWVESYPGGASVAIAVTGLCIFAAVVVAIWKARRRHAAAAP
ncbi:MAG: hypothetical protein ACYTEZ_16955 [Planctomycetota bacterium]|jgi:hypothetical protein